MRGKEQSSRSGKSVSRSMPSNALDHGRRGFLFADAIGRHYGWTYGREVLYLACLLHDIGLVPRFDTGGAFERDGADARSSSSLRADCLGDASASSAR